MTEQGLVGYLFTKEKLGDVVSKISAERFTTEMIPEGSSTNYSNGKNVICSILTNPQGSYINVTNDGPNRHYETVIDINFRKNYPLGFIAREQNGFVVYIDPVHEQSFTEKEKLDYIFVRNQLLHTIMKCYHEFNGLQ